ncbi:MAG: inner membrane CreD family protein [Deltaproteobacteria bacterium]|nr:inner membrane CreD family protein [Deltaproteobacteria bacterium]
MTIKHLSAIGFIFLATSAAWMILGTSLFIRTDQSDTTLREEVGRNWGTRQQQQPPEITAVERREVEEGGKKKVTTREFSVDVDGSDIQVGLNLEHRQKGLMWYAVYKSAFTGRYAFHNTSSSPRVFIVRFPFPSSQAIYDDFRMTVVKGGTWSEEPSPQTTGGRWEERSGMTGKLTAPGGARIEVEIAYKSQGMESWIYKFGDGVSQVKNFKLVMNTDFEDIDFPPDTISPGQKEKTDSGWRLTWAYTSLLSGVNLGMKPPEKLQPGPIAGRISFFAPVSLLFFILVLLVIGVLKGVPLHPMHFFFLSGAFFAFHLLMAYLVDQVSLHVAFLLAAVVSLGLVVSYLRRVVGGHFALAYAGAAQFVYLVLFSYAFFFKGLTGLAITIGAILTLFVLMQTTAKVDWDKVFQRKG